MPENYWVLLLMGIGGFLFHSLLKLKSLNDDSNAANLKFSVWNDYVKKDIYGILAALLAPLMWLFLYGEVATKYTGIQDFARLSFFVMGALGSYLLQLLLGRAKKQIRRVVDEKTNIADGVDPSDKP